MTATLKTFFCPDPAAPLAGQAGFEAVFEQASQVSGLPKAAAPGLASAFATALEDVFALPLGPLLEAAWGKLAALEDARTSTLADPSLSALAPLLDHKITSTHRPHVDLRYGGKTLGKVELVLDLALQLKGIELEFRRGRVSALRGGTCQGSGTLSLGGKTLFKRQSKPFPLTGQVSFGEAASAP
ncbi:hypothetical protein QO010_002749 [Caulobacter ginsengisoli]|uniref:Uncharacterized protein n=1 Tax=Caulobacter ginsengisoli TaxID=400775 RepID=A0ABU0ISH8_9CAUL|nr:hypothetical protein [Caulobacter ginsengisoli]MDQ0464965.1 hypothetical protein [Caulobacter ginsengisoli]